MQSSTLITYGPVLILYCAMLCIEHDHAAEKNQEKGSRLRNLAHSVVFLVLGGIVARLALGALPVTPRPLEYTTTSRSLAYLAAYIFLFDLCFYWYHRAQHFFRLLWPIHELHHSDSTMNVTTSFRTYWLDLPIQSILVLLPPYFLLGIEPVAALLLPIVAGGFLIFTHANVRLEMGALTPLLCGPQYHRVHHSREPQHFNRNFAQIFPIIDKLFGTYYQPKKGEFPPTGTSTLPSEISCWQALLRPFQRWLKFIQQSRK